MNTIYENYDTLPFKYKDIIRFGLHSSYCYVSIGEIINFKEYLYANPNEFDALVSNGLYIKLKMNHWRNSKIYIVNDRADTLLPIVGSDSEISVYELLDNKNVEVSFLSKEDVSNHIYKKLEDVTEISDLEDLNNQLKHEDFNIDLIDYFTFQKQFVDKIWSKYGIYDGPIISYDGVALVGSHISSGRIMLFDYFTSSNLIYKTGNAWSADIDKYYSIENRHNNVSNNRDDELIGSRIKSLFKIGETARTLGVDSSTTTKVAETTRKGIIMSNLKSQGAQAKDAAILVAKITTGKAINRNLKKMMKSKMPLGTSKLLDNPLASAVLANGVSLLIKQFLPDNERATQVSDMMVTASMMEAAEQFNVDELIDSLLGGLSIPGIDTQPGSELAAAKTVGAVRAILDEMGIDHEGINGVANLKALV